MPATPRFTVISAVYNVARYLDEFIASIESQTFPLDRVEVIMVDDGSTDGETPRRLAEWQARRPELVRVLTKPNGGQASARNLGMEHARGEWVTMPDPDDTVSPTYLAEVDAFLRANPASELAATNRIMVNEATGKKSDHPLVSHFAHSNRMRDLDEHPRFFHGSAPAAFFRNDRLREYGLKFDERIRPNFEDGHFCSSYLLRVPTPNVAFVRTAEYYYRRRADKSSTLNTSRTNPGRYTNVLRYGYLDALQQAVQRRGVAPAWLQNFVLYELSWYFQEEEQATALSTALTGAVADEFNELLPQIAALLDPAVIRSFSIRRFRPVWREILLYGYTGKTWHTPYAVVDKVDMRQGTMRVVYRFTGAPPEETIRVEGIPVEPLWSKVRSMPYFHRSFVRERIAWVPYGTVQVQLDGAYVELVPEEPEAPRFVLEGWRAQNVHNPVRIAEEDDKDRQRLRRSPRELAILRLARSRPVRKYFRRAWVLMDRIHNADDSAEHLFRWLRKNRRSINAWFVVERGTPDYKRLRKDGYKRVIPHGSFVWKLLMLNCDTLISSHADGPITQPGAIRRISRPAWRFVFLQHGVTKDDLSTWLNPKDMDIFVVSTDAEYHALVDDDTAYRYTTRETKLTGLPRFDVIREAASRVKPADRDLVLIAPTWRQWLVTNVKPDSQEWSLDVANFRESDFARNWLAVLSSPEIAEVAARHKLKVALLMHPNQQAIVSQLDVPSHVELFGFDRVRDTFARARVLATDYSSMAFNAAYIDSPIVYFQFDRDRVLEGGHIGRRGYFDYERDGFGPVVLDADDAVKAIIRAVETGPAPEPVYAERIAQAFPQRDGRCCERVADAIVETGRRVDRTELLSRRIVPPPAESDADSEVVAEEVAVDEQIALAEDNLETPPAPDPIEPS